MYHTSVISGIDSDKHGYVATAGYDNRVILWNKEIPIGIGFHDHLANQVSFSKDSRMLASSSSDFTVRIWSVPDMALLAVLSHDDDVEGISFNTAGTHIATASRDRMVRVFTVTGDLVCKMSGHTNDVLSVDWVDDNTLVSCGDDSTLRYWHIHDNSCFDVVDLGGMETDTLCVTTDGRILSGDDNGEITLFSLKSEIIDKVAAHKSGIKRLTLNDNTIISLSYDRSFSVWRVVANKIQLISSDVIPNIVWPRSCVFMNDNQIAFVTFGDRYVTYDLTTRDWNFNGINPTHGINALFPTASGHYTIGDSGIIKLDDKMIATIPSLGNFIVKEEGVLLTGGQDGTIYNGFDGTRIYQHTSPLNCCRILDFNGGKYALVGTYTGELLVLVFSDKGVKYHCTLTVHDNAIKDVDVSGNTIFTVCADHTIKAIALQADFSFDVLYTGEHEKIVNGCAVFKAGFVSVSRDLTLGFWGSENPKTIGTPNMTSIKCVATDRENYIVTGDYRGSVGIYDVANKRWSLKKLTFRGISSVCYDQESDNFLATCYGGQVYIFRADD